MTEFEVKSVGVAGAGVMGAGVAEAVADSKVLVKLLDIDAKALEAARKNIENSARLNRLWKPKVDSNRVDNCLEHIIFTTDYRDFADVDFIVENVTEKWEAKVQAYEQLDRHCPSKCVFAVNTSVFPIVRIAALTNRPTQVIGIHFMNPVSMKPAVEVIRAETTSDVTTLQACSFLDKIGKQAIFVGDAPGFVSNRVWMLTLNEAIWLVHDGVSSAVDVDRVFKQCFGHKMGPLETADLIGLDTVLFSLEALKDAYKQSKFDPCPLLERMVKEKRLGRKCGAGFYDYKYLLSNAQ